MAEPAHDPAPGDKLADVPATPSAPTANVAPIESNAVLPPTATQMTPEEQMAAFEKELKETDWGHQPC